MIISGIVLVVLEKYKNRKHWSMIKKCILLLLLLKPCDSCSQNLTAYQLEKIDSVLSTLPYDTLIKSGINSAILGGGYLDQGDSDKAKNHLFMAELMLSKAISTNPDDFTGYEWRGTTRYLSKKYSDAIVDFTKAIKLDPGNFKNYETRGESKMQLEDYYGAIDDFSKALSKTTKLSYSGYYKLYGDRGTCYLYQNKNQLALTDFNSALLLNSEKSSYYLLRGLAKQGTLVGCQQA